MKNDIINFLEKEKINYLNSIKLYITDDSSILDCKRVLDLYSDLFNLNTVFLTIDYLQSLFNLSDKSQTEKLLKIINK